MSRGQRGMQFHGNAIFAYRFLRHGQGRAVLGEEGPVVAAAAAARRRGVSRPPTRGGDAVKTERRNRRALAHSLDLNATGLGCRASSTAQWSVRRKGLAEMWRPWRLVVGRGGESRWRVAEILPWLWAASGRALSV